MDAPTENARPAWLVRFGPYLGYLAILIGSLIARQLGYQVEIPAPPTPLSASNLATAPIDYEGCSYHGEHDEGPEHLEAQPARWPTDRITWGVDYQSAAGLNPPLSADSIRAAIRKATGWWAEQLQIEFSEVPYSQALIPIRFEPIDGPTGVLAKAYLANGQNTPKPLLFDRGERWTAGPPAPNLVSLETVGCHELGHSLGLDHDAATALAVMRPTYTAQIPREQARDISRMVSLGYARRATPPPTSPPAGETFDVPARLNVSDVVEGLKRLGYAVEKR